MVTLAEIARKYSGTVPKESSEKKEVLARIKEYLENRGWENVPQFRADSLSFFASLNNIINRLLRQGDLNGAISRVYDLNRHCADMAYESFPTGSVDEEIGMFESLAGNAAKTIAKETDDPDWIYNWADCKQAAVDMRSSPKSLRFDYLSLSYALYGVWKLTRDITDLDDSYMAVCSALNTVEKDRWNEHADLSARKLEIARVGYDKAKDITWARRWYKAEKYRSERIDSSLGYKTKMAWLESAGNAARAVAKHEKNEIRAKIMIKKAKRFYRTAQAVADVGRKSNPICQKAWHRLESKLNQRWPRPKPL